MAGAMAVALALPVLAQAATLRVGDRAPNFTLPDQNGQRITLSNYLGKKTVVLAFYVLAFTGG
jgi:peroxiredoxin